MPVPRNTINISMRAFEFLIEAEQDTHLTSLEALKHTLSTRINQLPDTEENLKLLKEIEDILGDSGMFGRKGNIEGALKSIGDADLSKYINLMARFILGIPASGDERNRFLADLKTDTLINRQVLLTPGKKHSIEEVIPSVADNNFVREIVDALMAVDAYGVGKGEIALSVLSKGITKAGKGDLQIDSTMVELKAVAGGGGRFSDREIKPSSGYDATVKEFTEQFAQEIAQVGSSKTGINLEKLIQIGQLTDPKKKMLYNRLVKKLVYEIFPSGEGKTGSRRDNVWRNIVAGELKYANDTYRLASFSYYFEAKKIGGVLMIDLTSGSPMFVYLTGQTNMNEADMWLKGKTAYPVTTLHQNVYPQLFVGYQSEADPRVHMSKGLTTAQRKKYTPTN